MLLCLHLDVVMLLCIFEKTMRFGCSVNEVGGNAILGFCAISVTHGSWLLTHGKESDRNFSYTKKEKQGKGNNNGSMLRSSVEDGSQIEEDFLSLYPKIE